MNPQEATANKSQNITTNTTTVIPGKAVLIALLVGTKGASSNIAKVYDSATTTENLVATIDTVNTFGRIEIGLPFFNGIYIVTSAGTPANITVIYADFA